ncbi:hypothetical protein [uncultured Bdellovibrio sp.]|uniref:hypothetical protein n=1 Tax=Bdellovibrio sp. HCB-162 TaxID=3394234 RepID=UPI0025E32D33|nr:hypothetical protein [uncultured Bdellovibrio sp.]
MKTLKLLAVAALTLSFVACSSPKEDEVKKANGGGTPSVPSKPLPTTCSQDLLARLNWRGDRLAFGYTVEVGTTKDVYTETHTVSQTEKTFLFSLERGATYFIKATKYLGDGSVTQFQKIELYVPTCDKRADWQKAHPTYIEPFDFLVTWTNN